MKEGRISLVDFIKNKKREGCDVCLLPQDVRDEMVAARKKKINRPEVIEWLAAIGHEITGAQLDNHYSGKHEL